MTMLRASAPIKPATDAPTGFGSNGYIALGTPDDEQGPETFYAAKKEFDATHEIADGLGPVFNAQACRECHQTPMSGGSSQITVLFAGRMSNGKFTEHPGGLVIHDRAINPAIQETVLAGNEVTSFRISLSLLGDGFIEAMPDATFATIAAAQPADMRGELVKVYVLESPGTLRVGRFGWKNQHASLVSFSAQAYLNEMGITSPLLPAENTSNGNSVAAYDGVADPEDLATTAYPYGEAIHGFANFIRTLKAPARNTDLAKTQAAIDGQALFNQIGCSTCHTPEMLTSPTGTVLNGGTFTVTEALGNKRIFPYGDYLLHDIGTGDGIYQGGSPEARNKMRTVPLWGLSARNRFMHDGRSVTFADAIKRHQGQALATYERFNKLTPDQQNKILAFLHSL